MTLSVPRANSEDENGEAKDHHRVGEGTEAG
jgi:hypothetical protein